MAPDTPLHIEIYRALKSRIINEELQPGVQLPTENELAESFRVSRITAHRALQRLALEGWITRRRGKGSFVAAKALTGLPAGMMDSPESGDASGRLIGFILPDASEWYGFNLLSSVISASNQADLSVVVNYSYQSQENEETTIRRMLNAGVSGLLIYPVNGEFYNQEILRLNLNGFPLVLVDRNLAKIPVPYVSTDNRTAAMELTEHLIGLGHRHIGFLSPEIAGTVPLEERFAGYLSALERNGLAPDYNPLNHASLPTGAFLKHVDIAPVYDAIRCYLQDHAEMTGIVVTEYQYAVILTEICRSCGISVPDHLSIVCFDGLQGVIANTFTHIRQDEHGIGRAGVDMLVNRMDKTSDSLTTSVILPGTLILGKSSAPPRNAATP